MPWQKPRCRSHEREKDMGQWHVSHCAITITEIESALKHCSILWHIMSYQSFIIWTSKISYGNDLVGLRSQIFLIYLFTSTSTTRELPWQAVLVLSTSGKAICHQEINTLSCPSVRFNVRCWQGWWFSLVTFAYPKNSSSKLQEPYYSDALRCLWCQRPTVLMYFHWWLNRPIEQIMSHIFQHPNFPAWKTTTPSFYKNHPPVDVFF